MTDINHPESLQEAIDFRGTDEIVIRKAIGGVRRVTHVAAAPGYCQYRMMVLGDCDPGYGIGETQCPAVVWKFAASRDLESVIAQHPIAVYGIEQSFDSLGRQWLGATFTGLTFFLRKIIGHGLIIEKNRPRGAGLPEEIGPGGDS